MLLSRRCLVSAFAAAIAFPAVAHAQDAAQKIGKEREEMGRRVRLSEVPAPVRQTATANGITNPTGATLRDINGRKVYELESRDAGGGVHRVQIASDGRVVGND
jgi:hypothetical protein